MYGLSTRQRLYTLLGLLTCMVAPLASAAADPVELGRKIYVQGVRPNGEPLRATSAGNSMLSGEQAACIACHRKSAMGGREGGVIVSPVTGPILYAKPQPYWPRRPGREAQEITPLRQESRIAYDDRRLARAIRTGVDASGKSLHPLMPRYDLGDADIDALIAYLRQLSAAPVPGLEDGTLHLATIISADADAERSMTVVETLRAWAGSDALGTTPVDLQIWSLEGPATQWEEQLDSYYRARPVYAVISGAGRAQWGPVREFCELNGVPCLFPVIDEGLDSAQDFYSMYFSGGVTTESKILAGYLNGLSPRPARVVQLVSDQSGNNAARILAAQLKDAVLETRNWNPESPGAALEALGPTDALVGWLSPAQLNALAQTRPQGTDVAHLLFSSQLAPPQKTDLPIPWRKQARWVSLRSDPKRRQGNAVLALNPWLAQLKLAPRDGALQSEIYAAVYYFVDALARMRGNWSREFLLETLESANYTRPAAAAYFSLSLGPGQREAAKAGYLLGFDGPELDQLVTKGLRLSP